MSKIAEWLHARAEQVADSPFGNVAAAALHDAAEAVDVFFPEAAPLAGPSS